MTSKEKEGKVGRNKEAKKGTRHQTLDHVGVAVQFFLHFDEHPLIFFLDFEVLAVA